MNKTNTTPDSDPLVSALDKVPEDRKALRAERIYDALRDYQDGKIEPISGGYGQLDAGLSALYERLIHRI